MGWGGAQAFPVSSESQGVSVSQGDGRRVSLEKDSDVEVETLANEVNLFGV